jgi:glycosyltransferase involved in cell wall biosynthesis
VKALARPLRILHIVHDYYPAVGGSEVLFQRVAEGLAERGWEIWTFTSTARRTADFVSSRTDVLPPGIENVNGLPVRRFRFVQFPRPVRRIMDATSHVWSTRKWPGYGRFKAWWVGPHMRGLTRAAAQHRPDVIAATAAPFLPLWHASRAAARAGVPVVLMPCLHPGDPWLMDNPSLLRLLRKADGVMALTTFEKRMLRALEVDASRIAVVGGGVAPNARLDGTSGLRQAHGIPQNEPLVLFCGRKEQSKGVQQVVEAMLRLWQQGMRAHLVLAGGATEFSTHSLRPFIERIPPEWRRRALVRDDVTEAEKWGWYAACDLLAHPSHVESFGLVYLEAWSCAKPVIGGRTGPQAALIDDGTDGLLVDPCNAPELASAIRSLIEDPVRARRFGEAGRQKVLAEHTWERVVDRVAALYESLAARQS